LFYRIILTSSPADSCVPVGQTAAFTVAAKNAGFAQWQSSTDGISYQDIAGATSFTHSHLVASADVGKYFRARPKVKDNSLYFSLSTVLDATPPAAGAAYTAITGQQAGRMNRFAGNSAYRCGITKPFPGLLTTTGLRRFDAYTFTAPATECVTFKVVSAGLTTFYALYKDAFDPNSLSTNFLADPGSSASLSSAQYAVTTGDTYVLVIHELNVGNGPTYTVTVTGEGYEDSWSAVFSNPGRLLGYELTCNDYSGDLDSSGQLSVASNQVSSVSGQFTSCGTSSVSLSKSNFQCSDINGGTPIDVTVTMSYSTYTSTCTAKVTVKVSNIYAAHLSLLILC
jgi:hypothetical protein